MSTQQDIHTGSCLCGAVRYKVTGKLREVINCHCSLCRKFHGHYGAYTSARREDVSITSSNNLLVWYRSMENRARRGFCTICGSSLFWDLENLPTLSIAAGTLDLPTGLHTTTDIFTLDKSDYYDLDDKHHHLPSGLNKHEIQSDK